MLMTRHIRFFLYPSFQLLDLSGPLAAFQFAAEAKPGAYRFSFVSRDGGVIATSAGPIISTDAIDDVGCDTLIVPGGGGVHKALQQSETVEIVRLASCRAERVASVCTGAFLLAATGLLDGRRATTHWRSSIRLQAEYPAVHVVHPVTSRS